MWLLHGVGGLCLVLRLAGCYVCRLQSVRGGRLDGCRGIDNEPGSSVSWRSI
jgi:hypothetical protein